MRTVLKKIARGILVTLSRFYLKHDFFSIEGQYELEWKLRKNTKARKVVLWLSERVGNTQTYYHILKIDREQQFLESLSDNTSVRKGVFEGLRYPSLESYGSVLAAKLLGSYEQELEAAVKETLQKPYERILDVGCAEGYYAVGYALKVPNAQIHAFDINEDTLSKCKEMATLNGVDHKMTYYHRCTPELLQEFDFSKPSLIVSDCEGYESELFTSDLIPYLTQCDLLIEVHEKVHQEIIATLSNGFQATHNVQVIYGTVRDINKFPALASFSDTEKHLILYELRNEFEEYLQGVNPGRWLYITALAVA